MPFPNYAKLLPAIDLSKIDDDEKPAVRDRILDSMREAEQDYVNGLLKTDDIYHRATFQGMLRYICKRAGRPDYNDVILMDQIEYYYNDLCARYQQSYTIERYCLLIGCSIDYYLDMVDYWKKAGLTGHIQRVEYSKTENISSMQDGAMMGNPGYIFILKAKHGWSDQPQSIQSNQTDSVSSLEQIAQSIGIATTDIIDSNQSTAALPGDILEDE